MSDGITGSHARSLLDIGIEVCSYDPTETTSLMEKLLKMKSIWHAEHGKESYIFRFDVQEVRISCRRTKIPSLRSGQGLRSVNLFTLGLWYVTTYVEQFKQ